MHYNTNILIAIVIVLLLVLIWLGYGKLILLPFALIAFVSIISLENKYQVDDLNDAKNSVISVAKSMNLTPEQMNALSKLLMKTEDINSKLTGGDENDDLAELLKYLPDELIIDIMSRLSPNKICTIKFINPILYRISNDYQVWKRHFSDIDYTLGNNDDVNEILKSYNVPSLCDLYEYFTSPSATIAYEKLKSYIDYSAGTNAREITVTSSSHIFYIPNSIKKLTNLDKLTCNYTNISNLNPLSALTQLTYLDLSNNKIYDLTPLSTLTRLTYLNLERNKIINLEPISSLTELTELSLSHNQIEDIISLKNLTNLLYLYLSYNEKITDLSPLKDLTSLRYLTLHSININTSTNIDTLQNLININSTSMTF